MANTTITAPRGFRAAAVKSGIKQSGDFDLGLIAADGICTAAGVFTTNKIVAPAVVVSRSHLRSGRAQAVFVNAGNANTCTGRRGEQDVQTICRTVARKVGAAAEDVLVCSTGVIGHYLPMARVRKGIGEAAGRLERTQRAGRELARAILTTDTRIKLSYREIEVGGRTVRVAGIAKGSGMIAPNMATMLAFITTDVGIGAALLQRALRKAADVSFNKVSVDSHTSTSDSALVLASGAAGNRPLSRAGIEYTCFAEALGGVCDDLARQIAADGEGARCVVTMRVTGAATAGEARAAVRAIADSPLVRTALHGADPNWGRIVSAVGYSGARFDPEALTCRIAGTVVYRRGRPSGFKAGALSEKMQGKDWSVEVDLGIGSKTDFCYTCDLSREYVTINADYHT